MIDRARVATEVEFYLIRYSGYVERHIASDTREAAHDAIRPHLKATIDHLEQNRISQALIAFARMRAEAEKFGFKLRVFN